MSWSYLASSSLTSPQSLPAHSLDSLLYLAALVHVGTELLIGPFDDLSLNLCSLPGNGREREGLCLVPCDLTGWKAHAFQQTGIFSFRQSLGPAPSPPSSLPTLSLVQVCGSEPFRPSRPHSQRQMNQSRMMMRRTRTKMIRTDCVGRVLWLEGAPSSPSPAPVLVVSLDSFLAPVLLTATYCSCAGIGEMESGEI